MRQTFGEDTALAAGTTAPTLVGDGTDLVPAFRKAMRCAKLLLTVVVGGTGSVSGVQLHGYSPRNGGAWGVHHDGGPLDAVAALGVGSHHFVVHDFGGYTRAALVYAAASGVPTVTAFLTELIEAPVTVGD